MSDKHSEAVEMFKKLNDYCNNGNCNNCVFHCLGDCPFYILDEGKLTQLKEEAVRLRGED